MVDVIAGIKKSKVQNDWPKDGKQKVRLAKKAKFKI
jgi:hypothetical protein